jgi:hypothetical protein
MTDAGDKSPYRVGYAKPPRETRFRPGHSGNLKGRPKRAKNFATAIEEELRGRVTITENGRRRRVSKREVVAKRLVNRAAEGDPKLLPVLLNEVRAREQASTDGLREEIFGGPEQQPLIGSIVERIRTADALFSASSPNAEPARTDEPQQLELPFGAGGQPTEEAF